MTTTEEINKERVLLSCMHYRMFLYMIIHNTRRERMNRIVPRGGFPAYDIALNIYQKEWIPTEKQRAAITNVYLFYEYGRYK